MATSIRPLDGTRSRGPGSRTDLHWSPIREVANFDRTRSSWNAISIVFLFEKGQVVPNNYLPPNERCGMIRITQIWWMEDGTRKYKDTQRLRFGEGCYVHSFLTRHNLGH